MRAMCRRDLRLIPRTLLSRAQRLQSSSGSQIAGTERRPSIPSAFGAFVLFGAFDLKYAHGRPSSGARERGRRPSHA